MVAQTDRAKSAVHRRRVRSRWILRGTFGLLVATLAAVGWGLWDLRHWMPERGLYPSQGVEIGVVDGDINWPSLRAIGADFAYVDASTGSFARDPRFVANFDAARAAGIEVGAVHRYDPCQPAETQAANFVTTVPREADMLPPAVELGEVADGCAEKVSDAKVESELMTFLNQVETHAGKPVILKVLPQFQSRYDIAGRLDRNLWLVRDRLVPQYTARGWTLWTANSQLSNEIAQGGLRWVVVKR